MNNCIWLKNLSEEKNLGVAFTYDLSCRVNDQFSLRLTSAYAYKLFLGDKLIGYGPARAAHGYARIDEYDFTAEQTFLPITVEIVSYRVNGYEYLNEPPFFDCDLSVNGVLKATSADFGAFRLTDRIQKVQRYSFQRPFVEVYDMAQSRQDFYLRKRNPFPALETERVAGRTYLPRTVEKPRLDSSAAFSAIEQGRVEIDPALPLYKDRAIFNIGELLHGYPYEELSVRLSDEVSSFVYYPDESGETRYTLYDGGKELSGFINATVRVEKACTLYFVFDEVLLENPTPQGGKNLNFTRLDCCNALKYTLQPGEYLLSSFEPYSLRYVKLVITQGTATIEEVSMTKVENPAHLSFSSHCEDEEINEMMDAACSTFRQNAVDLLMDCPSRERAGWINDSYFSGLTDILLSGTAPAEKNHLENLCLSPQLPQLPKGMLPMCYPADHYNGDHIPNNPLWAGLELCRRIALFPEENLKALAKDKLYGALAFFQSQENADGLLENLKGWVFIEWSRCNAKDYVAGVNYPSNMVYSELLLQVGRTYQDDSLIEKGLRLKALIAAQSFNGVFFEDNRLREDGVLTLKNHITETCQYYAFFFGIATQESHPALYRSLFTRTREELFQEYPDLPPSNVIYGLLMRMQLLTDYGKRDLLLQECKNIFLKMAKRTGTLWEHNGINASCNHGIASVVAVWLTYYLTGYKGLKDGKAVFEKTFAPIDSKMEFFIKREKVVIRVQDGKRTITTNYPMVVED